MMKINDFNITIVIFVLSVILIFSVEIILVENTFGRFGDEACYLNAGVQYIKDFTNVLKYNWEHPPFAKYIFGFLIVYNRYILRLFLYIIGIIIVLVFYFTFKEIDNSGSSSLILLSLICFDLLYAQTIKYALLDVPMLLFSALYVYALIKYFKTTNLWWIINAGFFSGLAFACKCSFIYFFLPSLMFLVLKLKRLRDILLFICSSILMYLLAYLPPLMSGISIYDLLILQYRMLDYHVQLHAPSLAMSINALSKFFLKIEFWEVYSGGKIYIYSNNTAVIGEDFVREGWKLYFYYGFGGLAWWLFLPTLVLSTIRLVKSKLGKISLSFGEEYFILTGIFQTFSLTHGDISWYYFDVLPTFYILLTLNLRRLDKKYSIFLVVCSLIYNMIILWTKRYYVILPIGG